MDIHGGKPQLSGASLDEIELLRAGEDSETVRILSKTTESTSIEINGVLEKYSIVKMFDFTAERKMMSVVMKHQTNGKMILFTKGADSSVLTRTKDPNSGEVAKATEEVETYAKAGMRTLAFAMKELQISEAELANMKAEDIETDLTVLGVTGMEDLL